MILSEKIVQEAKMFKYIEKLKSYCLTLGVELSININDVNVIFSSKTKEVRVAHEIFFRYTGISNIHREQQQKNFIDIVFITDEMFFMEYLKAIIDVHFKIRIKK